MTRIKPSISPPPEKAAPTATTGEKSALGAGNHCAQNIHAAALNGGKTRVARRHSASRILLKRTRYEAHQLKRIAC